MFGRVCLTLLHTRVQNKTTISLFNFLSYTNTYLLHSSVGRPTLLKRGRVEVSSRCFSILYLVPHGFTDTLYYCILLFVPLPYILRRHLCGHDIFKATPEVYKIRSKYILGCLKRVTISYVVLKLYFLPRYI